MYMYIYMYIINMYVDLTCTSLSEMYVSHDNAQRTFEL